MSKTAFYITSGVVFFICIAGTLVLYQGEDTNIVILGLGVTLVLFLFFFGFAYLSLIPGAKTQPPGTKSDQPKKPSTQKQHQSAEKAPPSPTRKVRSGVIFISYRRSDSADVSGRIYDKLVSTFGKASVFKDVDNIPRGADFKEFLEKKLDESNVLIAIIGYKWLEERDSMGNKRLLDPSDFVRLEIATALARQIPVIPVLVSGANMPSEMVLPEDIRKLAFQNGLAVRPDPDFHRDMDRLINDLKVYVKRKSSFF